AGTRLLFARAIARSISSLSASRQGKPGQEALRGGIAGVGVYFEDESLLKRHAHHFLDPRDVGLERGADTLHRRGQSNLQPVREIRFDRHFFGKATDRYLY